MSDINARAEAARLDSLTAESHLRSIQEEVSILEERLRLARAQEEAARSALDALAWRLP